MTAQERPFTCNKCGTPDLPGSKVDTITVMNSGPESDPDDQVTVGGDLCSSCSNEWATIVATFNFTKEDATRRI